MDLPSYWILFEPLGIFRTTSITSEANPHLMEPCRDAAAQVMQLLRNDGARKLLGTEKNSTGRLDLVDCLVVQ